MTDDNETRQLDAIGTSGGKATVETTIKRRSTEIADMLFASRDHTRDDALVGEIVRICLRLDKAGFARLYAMAKTEEAAMDARLRRQLEHLSDEPKKPEAE
jgi:hypothetical protein